MFLLLSLIKSLNFRANFINFLIDSMELMKQTVEVKRVQSKTTKKIKKKEINSHEKQWWLVLQWLDDDFNIRIYWRFSTLFFKPFFDLEM